MESPQHFRKVNGTHPLNGHHHHNTVNTDKSNGVVAEVTSMIDYHKALLYRLSVQCPVDDVRGHCVELLSLLRVSPATLHDYYLILQLDAHSLACVNLSVSGLSQTLCPNHGMLITI